MEIVGNVVPVTDGAEGGQIVGGGTDGFGLISFKNKHNSRPHRGKK